MQERSLVYGFVACSQFLIFAVIGYTVEPRVIATSLLWPLFLAARQKDLIF